MIDKLLGFSIQAVTFLSAASWPDAHHIRKKLWGAYCNNYGSGKYHYFLQ